MSIPQNVGIKSVQHRKAMGNARTEARAFMLPILRDAVGPDYVGATSNAYGPERVDAAYQLTIDKETTQNIIAFGRLEAFSSEQVQGDIRLANKEAYRLYWLPVAYSASETDYSHNPMVLPSEVNPVFPQAVDMIAAGMRIWIALASGYIPGASTAGALDASTVTEFFVVDDYSDSTGDLVEFVATVVRTDSPRRLVALA
jgi:hypothetical protein